MQAFEARPPPLVAGDDGTIRVSGTRVHLEVVVTAFDAGSTAEEIAQQFPSLSLEHTYAVIAYILADRAAVDEYVARRRAAARRLRVEIEVAQPPDGIRARLLARRRTG